MEMLQFLEADREQIMSGLAKAGTPDQAQTVLEKEFDRLLLKYNEECAEERVRDEARHILQAAKMMIPLISAAGETRVWSQGGAPSSAGGMKLTKTAIACLAGGIFFIAAAVLGLAISAGSGLSLSALIGSIPAAILGGGLLFWSGRMSWERKDTGSSYEHGEKTQQVEILVNPDRVWSCLRGVILSADKSLQEAGAAAEYERSKLSASVGNGISPEEADLFSSLLESAYTRMEEDPEDPSVQEMVSQIRYYLHRKQVETVDYGGGKREWYELLPGKQQRTLRPALVRDGVLVRKGLAVSGQ